MSNVMDEVLAYRTVEAQINHVRGLTRTVEGARSLTDDPRFIPWLERVSKVLIAMAKEDGDYDD
jgi:gluconate kinase